MLTLNNDLLKTGQKIRKMSFKLSWFCAFFITPSDPSVKLNCLHIKSAFAEKLDRASTNWFQSCFLQNSRETPIPFILFIHCTKSGIRNCATMHSTKTNSFVIRFWFMFMLSCFFLHINKICAAPLSFGQLLLLHLGIIFSCNLGLFWKVVHSTRLKAQE